MTVNTEHPTQVVNHLSVFKHRGSCPCKHAVQEWIQDSPCAGVGVGRGLVLTYDLQNFRKKRHEIENIGPKRGSQNTPMTRFFFLFVNPCKVIKISRPVIKRPIRCGSFPYLTGVSLSFESWWPIRASD